MKKIVLAATAALLASTTVASAADLDRELGLIVSGVVDQWAGVQFIDDGVDDDTVFANGGEGRLSLPLGASLSAQTDVKYEYNSNALEAPANNDVFGPRFNFQGAFHLSHRDPGSFLLGGLAGAGGTSFGALRHDYSFFGGEAQIYMNDITFYAQGGYVDYNVRGFAVSPLDDGYFARGVLRWFPTTTSRLQLEGTYMNLALENFASDVDIFSVKARYDFTLTGMPIIGDTPVYLAYRGTFRDNCTVFGDVDDHTVMVGTSYSFSGDLLTIDRQGATLDTPDFNHSCSGDTGGFGSDRRLKTDIVALGTDAAGNKIYSWKYKADPVTTWVGVMAQDLVESHPEALVTRADGFYAVRYDLIGAQMMTLEQWNSRSL